MYTIPTFNLTCNVWRHGNATTNPPDLVVDCNLRAPGSKPSGQFAYSNTWPFLVSALFPALTDIRDVNSTGNTDMVEIPAGTGRFYEVIWCDDVAKGFPNEYRLACICKTGPWPDPMP